MALGPSVFAASSIVVGWGSNSSGQLRPAEGATNIVQLDAGYRHVVALRVDGQVLAWGDNASGKTNVPGGAVDAMDVSAGYEHSLALLGDGTVVAWGNQEFGQCAVPAAATNVAAVAAGGFHSLALRVDGTVMAWGSPLQGQASVPLNLSNVKAIAAGAFHSVALRSNGTVVAWGYNGSQETMVPPGLGSVAAIASGFHHTLALRSNGTVVAWGLNSAGQRNVPANLNNVIAIAAGYDHSLALKSDGVLVAWGTNNAGQFETENGGATNLTLIAAGAQFTMASGAGPFILENPKPKAIVPSVPISISIKAAASSPLTIQWERDAVDIPGANALTYTLVDPQPSDTGRYRARAFSMDGTASSRNALLGLTPSISVPRPTVLTYAGSNLTFSAEVTGTEPIRYQWFKGETVVAGATNRDLVFKPATHGQGGDYFLFATNDAGGAKSQPVRLTVMSPPVNFIAATATNIVYDGSAKLEVRQGASAGDVYQWQCNGVDLPGETNLTLRITNARPIHSGIYRHLSWTPAGGVYTEPVTVTVAPANPVQFVGRRVVLDAGDRLGTVSYQWLHRGAVLLGATNALLVLDPIGLSYAGDYDVQVISDSGGGATMRQLRGARLTVLREPIPGNVIVWGGGPGRPADLPTNWNDVVKVTAGEGTPLALRADGTATYIGTPHLITNVVDIAPGFLLFADGQTQPAPGNERPDQGVISVARGGFGLRNDGSVVNFSGIPIPPGFTNIVAIEKGEGHTFFGRGYVVALRSDGTLTAWGDNTFGQTNIPPGTKDVMAISVGKGHVLALRTNGSVVAWGRNLVGEATVPAAAAQGVVAVSAGSFHSVALKADGTIIAWGNNGNGGESTVPSGITNAVGISAGDAFTLAILGSSSGLGFLEQPRSITNAMGSSVQFTARARAREPVQYQWRKDGLDIPGATTAVLVLTNVSPAVEGSYMVVASAGRDRCESQPAYLYTVPDPFLSLPAGPAGYVVAWGANAEVPAELSNVVRVVANVGSSATFAFRRDGSAVAWGAGLGLPRNLSNLVDVAGNQLGLLNNGTVAAWSTADDAQLLGGIRGIKAISAGPSRFGITTNGHLVDFMQRDLFPTNLTDVVAVASGGLHALALRAEGTVVEGRLGGVATSRPGLSNVIAVAAGLDHSLALHRDGTVTAWGLNADAQVWIPSGISDVTAIAAGGNQSLALKKDRTVVAWGSAQTGATNVPPDLTNVVAIACGYSFGLALQAGPVFLTKPTNMVANVGQTVTFTAVVKALSPWQCQWFFKGMPIAGGTNATFTLPAVQLSQMGSYVIQASADGFTNVASANLAFGDLPLVTERPQDLYLWPNESGTLRVAATASSPLRYQWHFRGRALSGATNSELELENVQLGQAGQYEVRLETDYGRSTNLFVALTVLLDRPMGKVVVWGLDTNLPPGLSGIVAVSGGYRYLMALRADGKVVPLDHNGIVPHVPPLESVVAVEAGNDHVLVLRQDGTIVGWGHNSDGQSTAPPSGGFRAIASNGSASAAITGEGRTIAWGNGIGGPIRLFPDVDDAVSLAMVGPSFIVAVRANGQLAMYGSLGETTPAALSGVAAASIGNSHCLVLKADGTVVAFGPNLFGETDVPPGLSNVVAVAAGYGRSLVLNADRKVQSWGLDDFNQTTPPPGLSNVVALAAGSHTSIAVVESGIILLKQPENVLTARGSNVAFRVYARGIEPLRYQWDFNGTKLAHATNDTLNLTNVSFGDTGLYSVTVTSPVGNDRSEGASLTLRTPPVFLTQPQGITVTNGATVSLVATVSGEPPISFQWLHDNQVVPGAVSNRIVLANVSTAAAGDYRLVANNPYGAVTSTVATLTVRVRPAIRLAPPSQWAVIGSNLTLSVVAEGTLPLVYQWYRNGESVPLATNASLLLLNSQPADAGQYWVRVTNSFGSATSGPVTISVVGLSPTIIENPISQAVAGGSPWTLAVTAGGVGPLYYQWSFNADPIPNATNAELVLSSVSLDRLGVYAARVFNSYGSVFSRDAVLTLAVSDIIVDDTQAQVLGSWNLGTAADQYGSSYRAKLQGSGRDSLKYVPSIIIPGNYNVSEWHPRIAGPTTAVPHVITHAAGTTALSVNQAQNGGSWRPLGTFAFGAGSTGSLRILDANPQPGQIVADAIRFAYVPSPPQILEHPIGHTNVVGSSVTFEVRVLSVAPVSYSWQKDGANLARATNASFSIPSVQAADSGHYTVFATSRDGAAVSSPAFLQVQLPPLRISRTLSHAAVSWTGDAVLQIATNVAGPYHDLLEAISPYSDSLSDGRQRFFRLRR